MEEWLRKFREQQELYHRWAAMQGREPSWNDFMRYSGNPEADAYISGLQEEMAARPEQSGVDMPMGVTQPEAAFAGLPATDWLGREQDITPKEAVEKLTPEKEKEEEDDFLNKLFLISMMENMQGGDIGQAPAVVAGGGRREFPTMMRQFAPWEKEKPYWWMR